MLGRGFTSKIKSFPSSQPFSRKREKGQRNS